LTRWIAEPWQTGLVARGGLALVLVGLACGLIGAFVVMRGLAYAGESLAHAVLPGGIVAALVGAPIGWGAAVAAALAAFAVAAIARGRTDDDTALGIVFVGALGLAVILISRGDGTQRTIESFLFGNAFASTNGDLLLVALTAIGVVAFVLIGWRPLMASTFDPDGAGALGVRPGAVNMALLLAIALVVVAALQVVGSLLTLALLVTPAATARLITLRARDLVLLSGALGMAAGVGGLYLSYFADVAAGGSVVLVSTAGLLITLAASGALARWPARHAAQVP
jgi:ABC-type Mn2+/Zn2+ transport system permease subunit